MHNADEQIGTSITGSKPGTYIDSCWSTKSYPRVSERREYARLSSCAAETSGYMIGLGEKMEARARAKIEYKKLYR